MKKQIQLSVPNLNMEIVENLRECIETGWVSTGGRFIAEFEEKIAAYVGLKDAVSVQSGTAGLHVSLRILGVESGDEVIVPTLTFIAAVNPIKYMGAETVFMDCDSSFCLDSKKLERFCREECELREVAEKENAQGIDGKVNNADAKTNNAEKNKNGTFLFNKKTGRRVSAIVVVHVFGNLADMEGIMDIAKQYNLKVLEDATEALGSYYTKGAFKGKFAGTMGDMGVYSFNANKIITTGGGGMIVSENQEHLEKARYLTITAKNDSLYFTHDEVGYNYRMLNLQAALGVSQIQELEGFIATKKSNFELYQELLKNVEGLTLLPFVKGIRANYWFYAVYVDGEKFGEDRDALMHRLIANGIQCRPVWGLIHMQKPYMASWSYEIEKAEDYVQNVINIPCSTSLKADDVRYVCQMIKGE